MNIRILFLVSKIFKNISALILVERTFYAKKIYEFLQNHSDLKVCQILLFIFLLIWSFFIINRILSNHVGLLATVVLVPENQDVVQAGLNIPQCSLVLRYDVCRILVKESDLEFCL